MNPKYEQITIETANIKLTVVTSNNPDQPHFITFEVYGMNKTLFGLTNHNTLVEMAEEMRALANALDHELRGGRL